MVVSSKLYEESVLAKILKREEFCALGKKLSQKGKKVIFTNGCFDLLHPGHIKYLCQARQLGDYLFIGLNSDASIRRLKGSKRPIVNLSNRLLLMAGFSFVDYVTSYDEDTPLSLITELLPNFLVKGGDWKIADIVGHKEVLRAGGQVLSLPFSQGNSTSEIIKTVLERYGAKN